MDRATAHRELEKLISKLEQLLSAGEVDLVAVKSVVHCGLDLLESDPKPRGPGFGKVEHDTLGA